MRAIAYRPKNNTLLLVIDYCPNPIYRGINVAGIASEARQVKAREGKLGLVIVDYLQMMESDNGGNRSYELGDVGRGLYQLAGELEVPVLAIS